MGSTDNVDIRNIYWKTVSKNVNGSRIVGLARAVRKFFLRFIICGDSNNNNNTGSQFLKKMDEINGTRGFNKDLCVSFDIGNCAKNADPESSSKVTGVYEGEVQNFRQYIGGNIKITRSPNNKAELLDELDILKDELKLQAKALDIEQREKFKNETPQRNRKVNNKAKYRTRRHTTAVPIAAIRRMVEEMAQRPGSELIF